MAQGKKTFIFYSDWINLVREMDNEDAGELLKHILSYVNDEDPTTENKFVKMAFGHMKPMLKSDLEKWEEKIKRFSDMGKESAKKRKVKHKTTKVEPTLTYVEHTCTVNDNDNVNNTITTEDADDVLKRLESFAKNINPKTTWVEGMYRVHKLKEKNLTHVVKRFVDHALTLPSEKIPKNQNEFQNHCNHWTRIQIDNGKFAEYRTVKAKGTI